MAIINGTPGDDTIPGTNEDDVIRGGAGNDTIQGNNGSDEIYGEDGDDILRADDLAFLTEFVSNYLDGGEGNDSLSGADGDDVLIGGAGDDGLSGGEGVDTMLGGDGNDSVRSYWPSYYGGGDDDALLDGGDGIDFLDFNWSYRPLAMTVNFSVGTEWLLSSTVIRNFERFYINGGIENDYIIGGSLNDVIFGNSGNNTLGGGAGDDELYGYFGKDILIGGAGRDLMRGADDDDIYYVDDSYDIVQELSLNGSRPSNGRDLIYSTVDYRLEAGLSVESLSAYSEAGTDPLRLAGNEIDNLIIGNAGENVLRGGGGNDNIIGLAGNDQLIGEGGVDRTHGGLGDDWHFVDNVADVAIERAGEGRDIVYTSVSYTLGAGMEIEALSTALQAGGEAINLTGNEYANLVVGNAGANILDGGKGSDTLYGLAGADSFAFTTALGAGNVDVIGDFGVGRDQILLDDAVFGGLAPGQLSANAFVIGTAAGDGDDRVIYNPDSGAVYFDADGTGAIAAIQFARIGAGLTVSAADFAVF